MIAADFIKQKLHIETIEKYNWVRSWWVIVAILNLKTFAKFNFNVNTEKIVNSNKKWWINE